MNVRCGGECCRVYVVVSGVGLKRMSAEWWEMEVTLFFWTDNWVGGLLLRDRFSRLFDLAADKRFTVEEMSRRGWEDGGKRGCGGDVFFAWEEESVTECYALLHNIVL